MKGSDGVGGVAAVAAAEIVVAVAGTVVAAAAEAVAAVAASRSVATEMASCMKDPAWHGTLTSMDVSWLPSPMVTTPSLGVSLAASLNASCCELPSLGVSLAASLNTSLNASCELERPDSRRPVAVTTTAAALEMGGGTAVKQRDDDFE